MADDLLQAKHLKHVRKNLTLFLLHLPIEQEQTSVKALLIMLDHFYEHPEDYIELIKDYYDYKRSQTETINYGKR